MVLFLIKLLKSTKVTQISRKFWIAAEEQQCANDSRTQIVRK